MRGNGMKKVIKRIDEWFYMSKTRIILDILVGFLTYPYILLKKPKKRLK